MAHEPAVIWDPEDIERRLIDGDARIVSEIRAFAVETAPQR